MTLIRKGTSVTIIAIINTLWLHMFNGFILEFIVRISGYYRVVYEDALLDRISYEISHGKSFDEYIVAQLVGDIIEGAFADFIGFSDALGFLERVIQKAGPNPGYWNAIFNAFNKIEIVLHNTKHYDALSVRINNFIFV